MSTADDVLSINEEEFAGKHNFLAHSLLEPNANKASGNRSVMWSSHLEQHIQMIGSELPIISTGFEDQSGEYSHAMGYKKADDEYKVIKKFIKNQYNYVLLVQNTATKEYTVFKKQMSANLSEDFGVKYDTEVIDSYKAGDTIEKDTVLYHDQSFTDDMNLKIGTNLNVAYLAWEGYTNEDSVVISESAAEKMKSTFNQKLVINLNNNDIPLNLYSETGGTDDYKVMPGIGESIKPGSPVMATRRLNYENFTTMMNDEMLSKLAPDDVRYYADGKVIDINVYSNIPDDDFRDEIHNGQLFDIYMQNRLFYYEFIEEVKPLVEDEDIKISDELMYLYSQYNKFSDPENVSLVSPTSKSGGKAFDHLVVEITLYREDGLEKGSKVSNRYGGKNTVSLILPDDKMPHVTKIDGEDPREDTKINLTADICVNPQGVINRLNPAQNIEMELNFIGQHIRYRMESMDNTEDKWNLMISFIEAVDDDTAKAYHQVWDTLSDEDKDSLVEDAIVHGIYLQQKPFWDNVDVFKLGDIYDQFNVDRYTVDKVKKPMIFGEEYYVLLHHRTKDKFSVRSSSALSYQNLPTKSSDLKLGRSRINDNAIRLGEMETMNSNFMEGNLDGIMEILNKYGNSDSARKHMIFNQLTGDPYNPDIDFDLDEEDTGNNVKILDNYLEGIGYELHVSEENPDTELKDKINNLSTERLTEIMKDLSKEAYQSEDAKNDLVDELDPQHILDSLK